MSIFPTPSNAEMLSAGGLHDLSNQKRLHQSFSVKVIKAKVVSMRNFAELRPSLQWDWVMAGADGTGAECDGTPLQPR